MKRFSSNLTDEELYRLFRNAARHYDPKLNDSERIGVWESIATSLLSETVGDNTSTTNTWKRRCIALLMLWLLTGGLAIFRIIQLQEIKGRGESDGATNTVALKERGQSAIQPRPLQSEVQKKNTNAAERAPGYADIKKNITSYNCLNNNYTVVITGPGLTPPTTDEPTEPAYTGSSELMTGSDHPCASDSMIRDPTEQPPPLKKTNRSKHTWSIGIATGAEWSRVPGHRSGPAGSAYGLTLQYRFAPRWSVETGILVGSKIYSKWSGPIDQLSGTFWNEPNIIDAECRIIDIQMNIRYDVMHKRDGRLFTGAGLSSFRMQEEDYRHRFEIFGGWIEDRYRYFNENDHFFAAANIMAGYEHTCKRFSVQAASYLKIPLKHIGHNNINVISTGLQLSVKYNVR